MLPSETYLQTAVLALLVTMMQEDLFVWLAITLARLPPVTSTPMLAVKAVT